jgi:hypothetical protein
MPRSSFTKASDYFYTDAAGNVYFSVDEFIQMNELPDTPELRAIVIDYMQEILPGILILEHWIEDEPAAPN